MRRPAALRRLLLGLPAGRGGARPAPRPALAHHDVPASALLGERVIAEIRDRMRSAAGWPARFAVLDEVLRRRLAPDAGVRPELAYACRRLLRGDVPVAAVADEVGWSGRHLTGLVRAELGLRPKEVARVARFDRARHAVRPAARLADVAARHGYADQSHLVRDFRAFAGCPPSQWLADEFGFVQAGLPGPGQDAEHD